MTGEQCFEMWAPGEAVWSRWAKPVLFAQLHTASAFVPAGMVPAVADLASDVTAARHLAVVVDLAGDASVATGLALAERGYRPVPLFNTSVGPSPVVDAVPIVRQLNAGATWLAARHLSRDAPPAFLLDSRRMRPTAPPKPGMFDNRWIVFPQDLPSATFLRSRGITDVLLLHDGHGLQPDLAHVLLRWQQAGLRLAARGPAEPASRQLIVARPSWFRRIWYALTVLAGLRRNNAGGFGGVIPHPSSGG